MSVVMKGELGHAESVGEDGSRPPRGSWDGRCQDPGLDMFRLAYHLAREMGLNDEDMPDLRTENGVLHAYRPNGTKIRLAPGPRWEEESGYSDLLRSISRRA